jgi:vancomycin resistance protein YoaR
MLNLRLTKRLINYRGLKALGILTLQAPQVCPLLRFIRELKTLSLREVWIKLKKPLGQKKKKSKKLLIGLFLSTPLLFILIFNLYYHNKILPGVSIANTNVGGKTLEDAEIYLKDSIVIPEKITLVTDDEVFEMKLSEIDFSYNIKSSLSNAYQIYKSDNPLIQFFQILTSVYNENNLTFAVNLNQEKFDEFIQVISDQVLKQPVYSEVTYDAGVIVINKGEAGKSVETEKLKSQILNNLSNANFSRVFIPFVKIDPTISEEEANKLRGRAQKLLDKSITLTYEYNKFVFENKEILPLLDSDKNYNEEKILKAIDKLSSSIDRDPQNAIFNFLPAQAGEGGKVIEFLPAKEGITVDKSLLKEKITEALKSLEISDQEIVNIEIPVQTAPPAITTEEVNNLGIKELIGRGSSKFRGSISSRMYNIGHASSKFNGALVAPSEVFSFNDSLGDVSTYTGYKQAYIIKDGQTVLGDGGGVCQVSTTFFRAILDAGLPIIERRAHSYRVGYYEQDSFPGLDATVYSPTTDLKFKNDTPGHLLIQTKFNSTTYSLVFEIYGTSDGRHATTTKPVITEVTSPPEDLYIDDPALPTGIIKQIERKIPGAKVYFDYTVERNDETIIKKTFHSNFRPWQAVYLRGTGPVQ